MNLTTDFLGLELKHPVIAGACPLGKDLDGLRRLEDGGAAAVVLPSLFEEEILRELATRQEVEAAGAGFAEALSYLPQLPGYHVGPGPYLELVRQAKESLAIPVIGSLNGATPGGWTSYARKIQEAGADAIELNVFYLATDAAEVGAAVEARTLDIVRAVTAAVTIPVAVKLAPFYSAMANLARGLEEAGAAGLVLFNRFYQPDIDVDKLEVVPNLRLSTPDELRMRLRWLAILSGQVKVSLAATGGAHTATDVIKAIMAGANAVQMASALLIHGPEHVKRTVEAMEYWLKEHDYASVRQMRGSMNLVRTPNPAALARANYVQVLESWRA
jgi:dihydroorotate dehydrogenase (fumarate)